MHKCAKLNCVQWREIQPHTILDHFDFLTRGANSHPSPAPTKSRNLINIV